MSNSLSPIIPDLFDICQYSWHNRCVPKTLPMVDISAPVCCAPVAAGPLDDAAAREIALRLKALADPIRVKLGLAESTVSHHLTRLRRAGLLESERRGMNVYHRPRHDALVASCSVLDPSCCT
jgi:ArsR family transcriptional regulator, arsenate/arsenite/antimonite-responsive transcriptional repressor